MIDDVVFVVKTKVAVKTFYGVRLKKTSESDVKFLKVRSIRHVGL